MTNSIITPKTRLPIFTTDWLKLHGWDSYLALIYSECALYLEKSFLNSINQPDEFLSRWFELSIIKFIYDSKKSNNNIHIYKNFELNKLIGDFKAENNIKKINYPDFFIKIGNKDYFVEITHLNKSIIQTYQHIYIDGMGDRKLLKYIDSLKNLLKDNLNHLEVAELQFSCRNGRVRYSVLDWLDAVINLNKTNLHLDELKKVSDKIEKKLLSGLIDGCHLINSQMPSWISSTLSWKLEPTSEKNHTKLEQIEKLSSLKLLMEQKNIGYILAIGTSIQNYLPVTCGKVFAKKSINRYFDNTKFNWVSGCLIGDKWQRYFPEYYEEKLARKVGCDFDFLYNPNATNTFLGFMI